MYRRLEIGEKIEGDDEFFSWNEATEQNEWMNIEEDKIGEYVDEYFVPIRRKVIMKKAVSLCIEFSGENSDEFFHDWYIPNIGEELIDKEHREEVRHAFKVAFEVLMKDSVRVMFTDEIEHENI